MLSREEANRRLAVALSHGVFLDLELHDLPDDVDPALAVPAFLRVLGRVVVDPDVLLAVRLPPVLLRAGCAPGRSPGPATLIETALGAMDPEDTDEGLLLQWRTHADALRALFVRRRAAGRRPHLDALQAAASSPRLLASAQRRVAASDSPPQRLLELLVSSGDEASLEVLVGLLDRAQADIERDPVALPTGFVSQWRALQPLAHARAAPLFPRLEELVALQEHLSPAARLARHLGHRSPRWGLILQAGSPFDRRLFVLVRTRRDSVQYSIRCVESLAVTSVTGVEVQQDELGLGGCDVLELPAWIERAMGRQPLQVETTVRGRERKAVLDWLGC
jgi:hypothetical protein